MNQICFNFYLKLIPSKQRKNRWCSGCFESNRFPAWRQYIQCDKNKAINRSVALLAICIWFIAKVTYTVHFNKWHEITCTRSGRQSMRLIPLGRKPRSRAARLLTQYFSPCVFFILAKINNIIIVTNAFYAFLNARLTCDLFGFVSVEKERERSKCGISWTISGGRIMFDLPIIWIFQKMMQKQQRKPWIARSNVLPLK